MDEMQTALDELSESLAKKEEALAKREEKAQEQSRIIKTLRSQADQRSMLTSMDMDNIKFEMSQAENKYKMEIADRNTQIKRMESENENLKLVEKQLRREKEAATAHENGLQDVIDSLKDENVEIMAKNDSLRLRTPSFAAAEAATGSTPKASSVKSLPLPPPPTASLNAVEDVLGFTTHSHQQATSVVRSDEYAKLREELAAAEARSTRHYEEMKEYKSWLAQVEDEAYAAGQPDPVPGNPPGLWDQHEGSNVERGSQVPDFKEWVTRISRKEHE
eukprot:s7342_g1.t1